MAKILSLAEISNCRHHLYGVRDKVTEYCDAISRVLALYESDDVVQTFFASGSFGQSQYEDLKRLEKALKNYANSVSSELVPKTAEYLSTQEALVTGGED